jgi:hypothetical protein
MLKTFIKALLVAAVVVIGATCLGTASAEDVTLAWDANSESDLAGYYAYRSNSSGQYTLGGASSPNYIGTIGVMPNPQHVDANVPSGTWFYVVTAFDNESPSLESGVSNEVTATIEPPSTVPDPPANLHLVFLM